jgi:hypothetical protein
VILTVREYIVTEIWPDVSHYYVLLNGERWERPVCIEGVVEVGGRYEVEYLPYYEMYTVLGKAGPRVKLDWQKYGF